MRHILSMEHRDITHRTPGEQVSEWDTRTVRTASVRMRHRYVCSCGESGTWTSFATAWRQWREHREDDEAIQQS
jgi:hypothetical protein